MDIRKDFPILEKKVRGKQIVYFDNSCVTLKPMQVVSAMNDYYTDFTACGGRSIHSFAAETTRRFDDAHRTLEKFVNAKEGEVCLTKNTTEAINVVANGLKLQQGDVVITSNLEHNSNLIPWYKLQRDKGVKHVMTKVDSTGIIDLDDLQEKMCSDVKLVSLVGTSNVAGTTIPFKKIAKLAHDYNAYFLVDGAQTAPHMKVDVRDWDVDFFAFSGHKMLGPSGTGALYGKKHILEEMNQFIVGGETVQKVNADGTWVPEKLPEKFEAGLQDYAGAIGFGEAAKYLMRLGMDNVAKYEHGLAKKLIPGLLEIDGLEVFGPRDANKSGALAAFATKMDSHELAIMLDEVASIFVRSGQHCTHLFHETVLHTDKTVRPSLYIYNTEEEVDFFLKTLNDIVSTMT